MNPEFIQLIIELNRAKLGIFPLKRLNAVSIYTTDYYENYDYDIVIPSQRAKLVKLLNARDFQQISGRVICNSDKTIVFEFPKPNFTLGDDPANGAEKLINQSTSTIVLTPTQALLFYLRRFYQPIMDEINQAGAAPICTELFNLLYEHPANLEKVREWLTPSHQSDVFALLKTEFRARQQAGIRDRHDHCFKSTIVDGWH